MLTALRDVLISANAVRAMADKVECPGEGGFASSLGLINKERLCHVWFCDLGWNELRPSDVRCHLAFCSHFTCMPTDNYLFILPKYDRQIVHIVSTLAATRQCASFVESAVNDTITPKSAASFW